MGYVCALYFICGIMEVLAGCIRGMGYSVLPMLVYIAGVCGFRITWIYTLFAVNRTLDTFYIECRFIFIQPIGKQSVPGV